MELSNVVLRVVPQSDTTQTPGPSTFVPVALIPSVEVPQAYADAADWSSDYTSPVAFWGGPESEDYAYHNAATCPDCGGGDDPPGTVLCVSVVWFRELSGLIARLSHK